LFHRTEFLIMQGWIQRSELLNFSLIIIVDTSRMNIRIGFEQYCMEGAIHIQNVYSRTFELRHQLIVDSLKLGIMDEDLLTSIINRRKEQLLTGERVSFGIHIHILVLR